jgi:hypothetical protein
MNWHNIVLVSFLLSVTAAAHGDHEHGPSSFHPKKGGVVRSLETVHLEFLVKDGRVSVYLYDVKGKSVDVAQYPASAKVTLPKKKAQAAPLKAMGDHWELEFDAKGAHRYALDLTLLQGGHNDTVKYNVEPKK